MICKIWNFSLVKSSSTEQISGGDADLGGNDFSNRGAAAVSSPNVQIEPIVSKQRRDKTTNKQDEEEERGKIFTKKTFFF